MGTSCAVMGWIASGIGINFLVVATTSGYVCSVVMTSPKKRDMLNLSLYYIHKKGRKKGE
jgi:hypothetical protein